MATLVQLMQNLLSQKDPLMPNETGGLPARNV